MNFSCFYETKKGDSPLTSIQLEFTVSVVISFPLQQIASFCFTISVLFLPFPATDGSTKREGLNESTVENKHNTYEPSLHVLALTNMFLF